MQWNFIDNLNKNFEEIELSTENRKIFCGFNSNKKNGLMFKGGDILKITFNKGSMVYSFEGICLALRNKNVLSKNTTLILRNVIDRVGVEIIIGYFFNRIYNLQFRDFRRKRFSYRKTHLFYLRERINRQTKI